MKEISEIFNIILISQKGAIMKRILILSLFFIFHFFAVYSMTLAELQSNPQYQVLLESDYKTTYIDMDSIKILRNSSPYYSIKYIVYDIIYDAETINKSICIMNYNKLYSLSKLKKNTNKNIFSEEDIINLKTPNSGINGKKQTILISKLDGSRSSTVNFILYGKKLYGMSDYNQAIATFNLVFNEPFD